MHQSQEKSDAGLGGGGGGGGGGKYLVDTVLVDRAGNGGWKRGKGWVPHQPLKREEDCASIPLEDCDVVLTGGGMLGTNSEV